MKSSYRMLTLLSLAQISFCVGVESEFYSAFRKVTPTDDLRRVGAVVTAASLVDTNNSSPKIANSTNSFRAMRERGAMGGVSLGMSMSDVVSCFGKPLLFYSFCNGGPQFRYADIWVGFRGDVASDIYVGVSRLTVNAKFEDGLSIRSAMQDFIRVLGEPTRRRRNDPMEYLAYESLEHSLILSFDLESGGMTHLRLLQRRDGGFRIY